METHMMTSNTSSAKSRTVALPQFTKNAMTGAKTPAKSQDVNALVDAMWNGTVFGPYLVPLSRRAE
jgi:hypothetical protein